MEERNDQLVDVDKALESCDLKFREQCRIVADGLRKGFKYDGCTGVPDFTFGSDCCGEHDFHYQALDVSRPEADRRMRRCISRKGYPFIAWSYWIGVRVLAWPVWYKRKFKREENLSNPSDNGGPN